MNRMHVKPKVDGVPVKIGKYLFIFIIIALYCTCNLHQAFFVYFSYPAWIFVCERHFGLHFDNNFMQIANDYSKMCQQQQQQKKWVEKQMSWKWKSNMFTMHIIIIWRNSGTQHTRNNNNNIQWRIILCLKRCVITWMLFVCLFVNR